VSRESSPIRICELPRNQWTPIRYLLEGGVCLQRGADNLWYIPSFCSQARSPLTISGALDDAGLVATAASLGAIVVEAGCPPTARLRFVLSPEGRGLDEPGFMELETKAGWFRRLWVLKYPYKALLHHMSELAERYCEVTRKFASDCTHGELLDPPRAIFADQLEPWFAFDSAITAARRVYDALRYPLWFAYSGRQQGTPRSLGKLLQSGIELPGALRTMLTESWESVGVELKQYRDCLQHYGPASFGRGAAYLEIKNDIWTASLLIPDNPQERSAARFRFEQRRDALHYTWGLTAELHRVVCKTLLAVSGE